MPLPNCAQQVWWLARQRGGSRKLGLCHADFEDDPAGNGRRLLRPLRLNRRPSHHADPRHSRELHWHWLPSRHSYPPATGYKQCNWRADAYQHGGAVFGQEITTDLRSSPQFLSPRLYMNNGATAAAVLTIDRGSASKQTVEMRDANSLLPLA